MAETVDISSVPVAGFNQNIRDTVAKVALSMILGDIITIGNDSLEVWSKSSLDIDAATSDMTQPVGITAAGKLVTKAGMTRAEVAELVIGLS